jgi:hypothetical protein
MIQAIKLSDGRTIIELDEQMQLWESGGDSYQFHRPASDTWALLQLLQKHEAEIRKAAKEVSGAVK